MAAAYLGVLKDHKIGINLNVTSCINITWPWQLSLVFKEIKFNFYELSFTVDINSIDIPFYTQFRLKTQA